jgi:enoyl-CoA hydratase/carnithine racemase
MNPQLRVSEQGQTLVLEISNPAYRNALSPEMYLQGCAAIKEATASSRIRSIVLVGEGVNFCAGGNLHRLENNRRLERSLQADSIKAFHDWIMAIKTTPKPVVAAVEGAVAGAGCSLALACDFLVSAEDAVFLMAHSNIALSPDGGGSWSLASSMPRQLVNEILMFGKKVTAQRLLALGVVNRVVARGLALTEASALAQQLNSRAPNALSSVKALVANVGRSSFEEHLNLECEHFVANLHHENAGIGISAFLEKRVPEYG